MGKPFIRYGDRTSHGGTVISADFSFIVDGHYMARTGDMTVCPRCKGRFPIKGSASTMTAMGQTPALHGDKTACGAILISSQSTADYAPGGSAGSAAGSDAGETLMSASEVAAPVTSGICLECLVKAAASGGMMVLRS